MSDRRALLFTVFKYPPFSLSFFFYFEIWKIKEKENFCKALKGSFWTLLSFIAIRWDNSIDGTLQGVFLSRDFARICAMRPDVYPNAQSHRKEVMQ